MARVYILTTADTTIDQYNRRDFERFSIAAGCDKIRKHVLVDSPDNADIILFLGSTYLDQRDVRSHPLIRRYRKKCFAFDSKDEVIPFLPGVYVNIPKRWHQPRHTIGGFYLKSFDADYIFHSPSYGDCDYLFCFIGSARTHTVRSRLMALKYPRAYLRDTSALVPSEQKSQPLFMVNYSSDDQTRYGEIIARTKFVLCPRGYAPASWRLFETMKAGRVPVIISDQWVPPEGPAWETFSIRVKQPHVGRIPEILEEYEARAADMGRLARQAWEDWFSREVSFHRTVEWCLRLKQYRGARGISDFLPYIQLLRPFFVRHVLLPGLRRAISF